MWLASISEDEVTMFTQKCLPHTCLLLGLNLWDPIRVFLKPCTALILLLANFTGLAPDSVAPTQYSLQQLHFHIRYHQIRTP
eukprot:3158189-Amphidinium_carterae.1